MPSAFAQAAQSLFTQNQRHRPAVKGKILGGLDTSLPCPTSALNKPLWFCSSRYHFDSQILLGQHRLQRVVMFCANPVAPTSYN